MPLMQAEHMGSFIHGSCWSGPACGSWAHHTLHVSYQASPTGSPTALSVFWHTVQIRLAMQPDC